MARVVTLRDKIRAIIRKWKFVTSKRFLYNKKTELRRRTKRIKVWFLIHDADRGYSIFAFEFKRKIAFNVADWTALFQRKHKGYDSLYSIFTQAVLPAINNKGGSHWRFISLLAWTGLHDIRQGKDSAADRGRDKATKKRAANARDSGRRRH